MKYSVFALLLLFTTLSFAQQKTNPNNQDEELGNVAWFRDYDTALEQSQKQNKPVLILFQEVPGCATCRNYGHNVLSNLLMTHAIENEFIPLAIFNNKKGKDLKILQKFKEPTWNNPVVRIIDANESNLVPRVASDYSAVGLYNAMAKALQVCGKPIPEYMMILRQELYAVNQTQEAYYKMYCFWSGEKQLGSQEGVINTQAGFMNGEVVKVTYNKKYTSKDQLDAFAKKNQMQPVAKAQFKWSEKDEDYYLQRSPFAQLELTPIQRTKINSALGLGKDPLPYLSPSQKEQLMTK